MAAASVETRSRLAEQARGALSLDEEIA